MSFFVYVYIHQGGNAQWSALVAGIMNGKCWLPDKERLDDQGGCTHVVAMSAWPDRSDHLVMILTMIRERLNDQGGIVGQLDFSSGNQNFQEYFSKFHWENLSISWNLKFHFWPFFWSPHQFNKCQTLSIFLIFGKKKGSHFFPTMQGGRAHAVAMSAWPDGTRWSHWSSWLPDFPRLVNWWWWG